MPEVILQQPLDQFSFTYPEFVRMETLENSYFEFRVRFLHMAVALDFYTFVSKVCAQRGFNLAENFLGDEVDEVLQKGVMQIKVRMPLFDRQGNQRRRDEASEHAGNILRSWQSSFQREYKIKTLPLPPSPETTEQ